MWMDWSTSAGDGVDGLVHFSRWWCGWIGPLQQMMVGMDWSTSAGGGVDGLVHFSRWWCGWIGPIQTPSNES